MLARTRQLEIVTAAVMAKDGELMREMKGVSSKGLASMMRVQWYDMMRDMMTRPGWAWRLMQIAESSHFVLTDNPVVLVRSESGFTVLAPLSSQRLLVGGGDLPTKFNAELIRIVNCTLAAWAHSRVYSGWRLTVEEIRAALSKGSDWAVKARKPLFGHPERIAAMRSPSDGEAQGFWEGELDRLGPTVFVDPERAAQE